MAWAQTRPGAPLHDFLLDRLPAADCSVLVFAVLYAFILWTVAQLLRDRERLLTGLYAYAALLWMRLGTIWLFPLAPPARMVSLRDPFVGLFFDGREITKDLFFSGHVATAVLMVLLQRDDRARRAFAPLAAVVTVMLLVQHAHYTVDVVAAPAFAGLAYRFGLRMGSPPRPAGSLPGQARAGAGPA